LKQRSLLVAFSVAHFAQHVVNSLLSALLPFMVVDGLVSSNALAGFAVTVSAVASGVTNAPLGVLADRVGPRKVIVAGLFFSGVASVAIGLSGNYWMLLVAVLAMGIASGTYHAPASALIAEVFSFARRGVALGTHTTAGHLAFFAAPLVAGFLATTGTWRTPYLLFALAPVICALLILRVAPTGVRSTEPHPLLATFADVNRVVRAIGSLVTLSILAQMLISSATAFLALYLVNARGVSPGVAAALFGVPQLAGLVAAPLSGVLSDRFGRPAILLGALIASGPSLWLLTITPVEFVIVPLLLMGACHSFRATATEVLIIDNTPPTKRSTVLGTYYLVNQPVGGIAAPVFGIIADAIGIGAAFSWLALLFVVFSAAALLARATGVARIRAASSPG
jgi:MFS family permease